MLAELSRADEQGSLRSNLQERWAGDGLPSQPVDGHDGEEQLRLAVDQLRQFAVTAEATVSLWQRWTNADEVDRAGEPIIGMTYTTDGDELGQRDEIVPRSASYRQKWLQDAARLRRVADAIEDFLINRELSDG